MTRILLTGYAKIYYDTTEVYNMHFTRSKIIISRTAKALQVKKRISQRFKMEFTNFS